MNNVVPLTGRANERLSFSAIVPNLQIYWDSVSLGAIKKCARYYQYTIIEGWQPRAGKPLGIGGQGSLHLTFGLLYHKAMETYAKCVAPIDGAMSHNEALLFTLNDLADRCTHDDGTWWNPNAGLHEKAANENSKTLPNLFRTVVWYLDQYGENDPCETVILEDGSPAVELSFIYGLGTASVSSDEEFHHVGHIDRLVTYPKGEDTKYFMDWKTSKNTINQGSAANYFAQFSPNNQMTGYTVGSKIALNVPAKGGIINAAQIAKGFSRFERSFITRTDSQLDEWLNDTSLWISLAEQYATVNYWPMNDTSCSDYGGCTFRGICSKSPEVRHIFLQSDFEQRLWDPLAARGDI